MSQRMIWHDGDDPELALRVRPLREHWEARGPGLLKCVVDLLPWLRIPDTITVRLVKPTTGGGGALISPTEIQFAAVLANPLPTLPEVVRLGWLCMQLGGTDLRRAALIPPAIASAQHVDLAVLDEPTLQIAIDEWLDDETAEAGELLTWWHNHRDRVGTPETWRSSVAHL